MARTLFITYFIALTIYVISAYQQECAVGPQYWCKSFQNAQDCGAVRHCTDTVWRHDRQQKQIEPSTKCQWCEKIMKNTYLAIKNIPNNEDAIKTTLINGCKMLPLEDISSKCMNMVQNYATTVLLLMQEQRYDRVCQLMNICEDQSTKPVENISDNDQAKILCNVIVQATHNLHVNQQKTKSEIEAFLKKDCQQLKDAQLVQKCDDLLEQHGSEIYAHVASNVELSKICDYVDSSSLQSVQPVQCELCTVVLSNAKQMLTYQQTEDKVLIYIDEQICSRLSGSQKQSCKKMVDTNAKDLMNNIKSGMHPLLVCTHFQVCVENVLAETSPVEKEQMYAFLQNNFCAKLGSVQPACEALIEKDATRLLQILANDMSGKDLCHMFGLCPKKSILLDEFNLTDDPSKCKRCVRDFTRRKHIAERLVNHSSEFLHHLCGQLPQQDDCIKSVDDSINELVTFIRSLDPKDICVQLNMCDQKSIQTTEVVQLDDAINEEIVEYIKTDICPKLGSLSSLCEKLTDSEGLNLLNLVQKTVDPHQICAVLDICPSNSVFQVCQDKCQCCSNKVEIYQRKIEDFMRTIVASTRILCDNMPARDKCLQLADVFESNVNKVVARFDSKRPCQLLNLCETKSNTDQCQTCQTEVDIRQTNFRNVINELTPILVNLCQQDKDCLKNIQTLQQQTLEKLSQSNSQALCQKLGYCFTESTHDASSTSLRLKALLQHQTKTLEQRIEAHDTCSEYGQLKSLCQDLLVSLQSRRYASVYMALLKNDKTLIDNDFREQLSTKPQANLCDACKNAVQSSKDFWNKALNSVRNVLLSTCKYCQAKSECQAYYNQRFDDLTSYITNIDATQFCQTLHLCSSAKVAISAKESEESYESTTNSNSTCILCEYVMNILSNYIRQQSTADEIEQSLEKVCQQMPSTLRSQCREFVEDYSSSIIATLIRDFDVTTICRKLNLCTKQMQVDVKYINQPNTGACSVCDYISTYLQTALNRDAGTKSVQQALANVCTQLSAEQKVACQTLVQLFAVNTNQIELGSGTKFCKQLPICQTPMRELTSGIHLDQQVNEEQLKEILTKNLDDLPECTICRYVITYLDAVLKNNQSEAAVEAALARICTILPRKDRVQCTDFIRNYGSVLTQLIFKFADPQLVCRYLGMCQAIVPSQDAPTTYSNHHYARIPPV